MPEPMKDVPLTTEINSGTSISEFSVSQQNELRTHLNNQEIQAILTNAGTLLKNLKDRKIQLARDRGKPPAHSLFSKLKNFSIVKDSQTFKGYFARANTFFLAVNPQQITNTSCLTSMLKSKNQIKKFAEESEENIQAVAANPCLKQIASMCNGKGLPDKAKVEAFVAWECWKVNGEFSLELLRAFSSMMSSRGLLDKAKVEAFVAWECWKVNGEFSLELLRAFSSMCNGKGLPDKAKVEAFVAWECWKVNGEFSLELLRAFSSMMSSRGLPDKAKVEAFVAWECWKVNGEFSLELLRAFSSMCNGKGLPDKAKVEAFVAWECWKVNGEFSLELLRGFSSMCNGKGLPDKAKVEAFVAWECWKVNGEFSLELLRAFSSMCHGKGLPDKAKVEAFVALECWKVNGEFNLELLRAFSSMCHGKGLPDKAKVEALKALECWKVNGEFSLELLRAFSSMCHAKGLPDKAKVEAFVALECWKVNGEFSLELLRAFSSMCNGKGLPDKAKVEAFVALECWKVNGEFSLELLRAFSSMMSSRGLPDKAKVEAFVAWECWKVNGEFSLELLRAFSSMMSSRGLPDKAKVEAFVALECWKVNGEFSLELLRAFSSMCHGKGLPDKAKVEALKAWKCWKVNGKFSLELLRAFSSMCHGKGLPDKAKVEAFVVWECWKVNGEFSLELLRAFSSMMSSRGLPDKAKVEAFVAWECWKVNGEFSLELLRAFSSMCNGKGLPDKAKVEAFVAWECWKVNGEFSLELLRAFSSMMSSRGLPDKAKVEALKAWECWKVNGEFSLELLRAFSSMMSSRGLPDKAKVEAFVAWECWKVNGEFSLELLRAFSSMMSSRGLPDKAKVEALKAWECWKVNGEFSLELLRAFSSMCHGKGLPDNAKVEAFVAWKCWKVNGEFSLELLRAFSSMMSSRGLPDKAKVEAFVQWLPSDENQNILKLSCRIFASFGLPSGEKLTENEKTLRQCLNQHGCTTEHGDDNSDEDLLESSQMKALALFFSGPAKWRMKIAEFQQYLAAHKSPRNDRVAVRAALKSLLPILAIHGGTGIQFWMEKYRENPRCKGVLTQALSIPAPLALTKFALTQLPESEMQEYLELCRNLKPAPTQEQWYALKPLCQQLGQRFDCTQSKRTMLEILWQQSADNCSKYADKMDELFKTLPTISQWRGLHRVLGQHQMQQFMDACLDYQATPETAPDVTIQQRLLAGMLLTNHSLPEQEKIPDLCFSNRVSTDDKRGVMVGGDPAMSGQERLWRFITAMLIELEQTEYQFKNQRLTVLPADGDPVVLQNPEFTLRDTGFVIKNWTLQQLTAFFKATEFTEQWYKKPQDKRDPYAIRLEAKLAQMKARTKEPKKAKPKKILHLVAPSLIISLINCNKPLKPAVWSSLEHYASSGQLNARLCTALSPVIKDDKDGIVPDLVKKAVVAKLEQIEAAKTPVVTSIPQQGLPARASIPTQGNQVANSRIQGPLSNFDAAMEALDRFRELGHAELELLEPHRSRMTYVELSTAICKMSYAVDSETRKEWTEASEKRRRDPLGLDEIVEWDLDSLATLDSLVTESELVNNDDWMEEFLQGL
ncbi:hypothetical protein ACTL6P_01700 [Endozoicomonas acroporae]|uniref:hypothetical protein n=1 Tax=Endozoicomonas acroporae TaxID=1701104 RepID=UPI003F8A42FF